MFAMLYVKATNVANYLSAIYFYYSTYVSLATKAAFFVAAAV